MRAKSVEGGHHVGLKAPSILTFMFSVILAVVVITAKYFGAEIPGLQGSNAEFWGLLMAYCLLMLGCMTNWL
jgi:hypothetical protein